MSDHVEAEVWVTLKVGRVEELVLTFRELLKQTDATNFLMLRFNDTEESKEYLVTIQVAGGKTPIERIKELEDAPEYIYILNIYRSNKEMYLENYANLEDLLVGASDWLVQFAQGNVFIYFFFCMLLSSYKVVNVIGNR